MLYEGHLYVFQLSFLFPFFIISFYKRFVYKTNEFNELSTFLDYLTTIYKKTRTRGCNVLCHERRNDAIRNFIRRLFDEHRNASFHSFHSYKLITLINALRIFKILRSVHHIFYFIQYDHKNLGVFGVN